MGAFTDFLERLLFAENENEIDLSMEVKTADTMKALEELWAYRLALNIAAERIGSLFLKCEWKTYLKKKEHQGDNWYLFNVKPNRNQSAAEFKKQIIRQLIMSHGHECLIVQMENLAGMDTALYVAESFDKNAMQLYPTTFKNVTVNVYGDESFLLNGTFQGNKAIYIKYQNAELNTIFKSMKGQFQRLIANAEKAGTYRQKYVLEQDQTATGNPDFNKKLQALLNVEFEKFIKGDDAVIPLYAGMKIHQTSAGADLGQNASVANKSINAQIDEALTKIGLAFNLPKSIMLGDFEADDLDHVITWALDPIARLVEESFNGNFYTKNSYKQGTKLWIDTLGARHLDVITMSAVANNAISSGTYTINELRTKAHEDKTDSNIGDIHYITRNYAVLGDYITQAENSATYTEDKRKAATTNDNSQG